MNFNTWVFIALIAALLVSYALYEYGRSVENERLKNISGIAYKTALLLNIFRVWFFNGNIKREVFNTVIICGAILLVGIFVTARIYRFNRRIREEYDEETMRREFDLSIENDPYAKFRGRLKYAVGKQREAADVSREEWDFIKFVVIAGIIFFAVMFGAYYLSHNVL